MAVTTTITYKEDKSILAKCGHGYNLVTGTFAFDDLYATDGCALDMSAIFPIDLHLVLFAPTLGYSFEYDYTAKKVKAFVVTKTPSADPLEEVADTTDLNAAGLIDVRFIAIGK